MKLIDPAEMRRMSAEERIRKLRGEKASLSPIAPSLVRYMESGGKSDYETASPADVGFGLAKAALTSAKKAQNGEKGGAQSALKAFEQAGYSFTPQGVHFDPAKVKDEAVRRRQPKDATAQLLTPQAEPEKAAESATAETQPGATQEASFGGGLFTPRPLFPGLMPKPRPNVPPPPPPAARPRPPMPIPEPDQGTIVPNQGEDGESESPARPKERDEELEKRCFEEYEDEVKDCKGWADDQRSLLACQQRAFLRYQSCREGKNPKEPDTHPDMYNWPNKLYPRRFK
ncbi:hypothetical protein [Limibacillus halophilus]